MELTTQSTLEHEQRTARVAWAVFILYYLTLKRSHTELPLPDATNEEEEGYGQSDLDAETERIVVLQGPSVSIRSKFLDCIAQLLSPSKGWDNVTATALREHEDFVEIDVARNDCFGTISNRWPGQDVCAFRRAEAEYCRELKNYLSTTQQPPPSEFELLAIAYTGKRVDGWVERLRDLLCSLHSQDSGNQDRYKCLLVIETWARLVELLCKDDIAAARFREQIVQQAYECVTSKEIHQILHLDFEPNVGPKLWSALRFVARPVLDCRMLWYIANQYPQFRDAQICRIPPRPKTSITLEYQIDISEAWAQLASVPTGSADSVLAKFSAQFEQNCADSYSLHAEMQLFMHYEDNPNLIPTVSYFGCSKKACLLCDAFLRVIDSPIATRGGHGICYPAWGIPQSRSTKAQTALRSLEKMLVFRIKSLLDSPAQARKAYFASPVPQSTIVSTLITQDQVHREKMIKSAKEVESARIKERLILEGAAVAKDRRVQDFEPHDSCVMCNTNPAKQCKQCHSSWYCSQECQKSDWPSHKLLCKDFSIQASRPSPNYKRAIFFPVDGAKPQIIWLPCQRKVEDDTSVPYETIDTYPYLGSDRPCEGTMRIEHNPVRGRNLGSGMVYSAPYKVGYSIAVIFRDRFLKDGSAMNKSILKSVSISGIPPHSWRGPIVTVRATPTEFYEDITLVDFRHIIDYMISYRTTETRESVNYSEDHTSSIIRGVKICCYGEEKLHGSKPYSMVNLSRAHPTRLTYGEGAISPISKLLGMPLKLWKYPDIDNWINPPGWTENMNADSNPNVAFLMMGTDANDPDWGWAPLYWNTDLGNVLAVRTDDKDLVIDDIRMICYFARWKLQPLFEDAMGAGTVQRTKQEVLDFATWENMVAFAHKTAQD